MNNCKALDQFYTNDKIAFKYTGTTIRIMKKYLNLEEVQFLEPSAGDGAFLRALKQRGFNVEDDKKIIAVDIEPKHKNILKYDFFDTTKILLNLKSKECVVTVGNPPFGKRAKLAIEFFNHAATFSDTIAFVVPLQFQKWSVHSKLNKDFRLIYDKQLPENSFVFEGKPYDVRCCFQIWTRLETNHKDLRIKEAPPIEHEDFEMFQYNNTIQASKFFDKKKYKWDFAVPRQGYYDYEKITTNPKDCDRKMQWIFFKAKNKTVLNRLKNIDFKKLSRKNTTVPGFGKADVVQEYIDILKKEKRGNKTTK